MKYNLGESDNRISIALTREQWEALLYGEHGEKLYEEAHEAILERLGG